MYVWRGRVPGGSKFHLELGTITHLEVVYKQCMMGAGPSYRERQQVKVQCSGCGEEMALGLLAVHLQAQHRKATEGRHNWGTIPLDVEPHTYKMAFPTAGGPRNCPIKGCR